jgi:predicted nucleotide-binding protein
MYYQVVIETSEKIAKTGKNKEYFELDKTDLSEIEERVVYPFLKNEDFQFNGYFLKYNEIKRIAIKETQKTSQEISGYVQNKIPPNVFIVILPKDIVNNVQYTQDITTIVFDKARQFLFTNSAENITAKESDLTKVFIVHGRDEHAKTETARFIEKLGFEAIVLHEQVSSGMTIIEKIEAHSNVGFAIILYTPCDIGSLVGEENQMPRARQNVVFEHGYFIGKLGRNRVCALVKGEIQKPTDVTGVVYIPFDTFGAWRSSVAKELRNAGYCVDMNRII